MSEDARKRRSKPSTVNPFRFRVSRQLSILVVSFLAIVPSVLALSPGEDLAPGVFPAVGRLKAAPPLVSACTATLIADALVLTAAHCVCEPDKVGHCASRASFEFSPPYSMAIHGTIRVHPEFGVRRWLNEDLAVIHLDYPSSQFTNIAPIAVEHPGWVPTSGTPLRLVGFGHTGSDCRGPAAKRMLDVFATEVNSARVMIKQRGKRNCPGDSGGPILNMNLHVVGVMSWTGEEINGRPTYANYNFIFGLPGPSYIEDRPAGGKADSR